MERPKGEPTHSTIYRLGNNGVFSEKNFGGVDNDAENGSVFDTGLRIYRPRNESDRIKDTIIIKPTGGVVGGAGGSIWDPDTMQYIPIEEFMPECL